MSKSKQKKFSKVQAVKEKSRAVLGSPKPTSVRSSRPRSSAGTSALDPTLNQRDASANPHYVPRDEHVDGAPRLSTVEGLHVKNPVILKPPRTKAPPAERGMQYSPEVIAHCNVLRAQRGENAVRGYLETLKNRKEEKTMSSVDLAERLTREHDSPVPVNGSIETALHDAEMKLKFYQDEVRRCSAEADRWTKIVENLKSVLELTSGPLEAARVQRSDGREMRPRGFWAEQFKRVLVNRTPLARLDFFAKLKAIVDHEDVSRMYPALYAALKAGTLIEVDGKIGLTEWTDPKS